MQHSTLLNSILLDGVGLRGQTNATCAVRTRTVEIKDLGRIMIPNFRPNYPLPMPGRWLATRVLTQKCWTMLHQMFDGNQTSFNIIQHHTTSCNIMQHHTTSCNIIQHHTTSYNKVAKRLRHVAFSDVERCWIAMLHSFGHGFSSMK